MLLLALIASSVTSAAGIAPEELKPNRPKDVMNMNVKFWFAAARATATIGRRRIAYCRQNVVMIIVIAIVHMHRQSKSLNLYSSSCLLFLHPRMRGSFVCASKGAGLNGANIPRPQTIDTCSYVAVSVVIERHCSLENEDCASKTMDLV